MNELKIQTLLVNAANATPGGFAFKQANRFRKGVVDLYVKLRGYADTHVEVKYEKKLKRDGCANFALTVHQREFLRRVQKAGGRGGWCFVVNQGRGNYLIACSGVLIDDGPLSFADGDHRAPVGDVMFIVKKRDTPWPIEQILKHVILSTPHHPLTVGELEQLSRTATKTTTPPATTAPTSSARRNSSRSTSTAVPAPKVAET